MVSNMEKTSKRKKRKPLIIENSKKELINQAEIISRQFENIVDTHFNSRAVLYGRQLSELKAISFALEGYDDIDEARAFLNGM